MCTCVFCVCSLNVYALYSAWENTQVFLMRNRATGEEVAAKCLEKHNSWSADKFRKRVAEEVAALQHTRHRNVIELIDHLPDACDHHRYWVVMKYARGGQLLERLIARHRKQRPYTEDEVSKLAYDILSGLKHLRTSCLARSLSLSLL